jgi:hypothetical protein
MVILGVEPNTKEIVTCGKKAALQVFHAAHSTTFFCEECWEDLRQKDEPSFAELMNASHGPAMGG